MIKRFLMWLKPTPKKSIEIVDLIFLKENGSDVPFNRRNGTTTRIADVVVQRFFKSKRNEKIIYNDHFFKSRSGDDHLRNIIERRLIEEHRLKKDEHFFSSYDKRGNVLIKKF